MTDNKELKKDDLNKVTGGDGTNQVSVPFIIDDAGIGGCGKETTFKPEDVGSDQSSKPIDSGIWFKPVDNE